MVPTRSIRERYAVGVRTRRQAAALVAVAAVTALTAATVAPLMAAAGRVEAVPLYLALETICHQSAERSWFFGELQAGLCVRCYGLYAGMLLAAAGAVRFSQRMLAAGALLMALMWGVEAAGAARPADWLRFASGGAMGAAVGAVLQPGPRRSS